MGYCVTHSKTVHIKPPAEFRPYVPLYPEPSTEVPAEDYEIVVFENKFPSLKQPPRPCGIEECLTRLHLVKESVRSFSIQIIIAALLKSPPNISEPMEVNLLIPRTGQKPNIQYVMIRKQRRCGGVTLAIHGQIMPFLYSPIRKELQSALNIRDTKTSVCAMIF